MPKNILIVLPYSGAQFGGGLAVLNQKLILAFDRLGHVVKLVTMELPVPLLPKQEEHGHCEIIQIDAGTRGMVDAGGPRGEKDRDKLYELINSEAVILNSDTIARIKGRTGDFVPDIIIGHSRFSGPAAILLKERVFPSAKVEYFLHSFPVEGSAIVGYGAYEMNMNTEVADKKFALEKQWMPKADIVVGMGPLIRAGAMLILEEAKAKGKRVHEALPGIELTPQAPVVYRRDRVAYNLLLCGRASAPIKGLEDLLLAVRECWDRGCKVHVDVLWWEDMDYRNATPRLINRTGRALPTEQWAPPIDEADILMQSTREHATTRRVNRASAQEWIDEMMSLPERAVTLLGKALGQEQVTEAYRSHDAVLMPSYIEHFGLVPFEALGHGVPVLVNQVSGSGMFLGDAERFPTIGPPCVVHDFLGSMSDPRQYLVDVAPGAFDSRPRAWAKAIVKLCSELELRFTWARRLRDALAAYTYDDFARGVIEVADAKYDKCKFTYQAAGGSVVAAG